MAAELVTADGQPVQQQQHFPRVDYNISPDGLTIHFALGPTLVLSHIIDRATLKAILTKQLEVEREAQRVQALANDALKTKR